MKVCNRCGDEIDTKDDENFCAGCQAIIDGDRAKADAKKAKANLRRRERDAAMRSIGMVKVKGALGGTYWE